MIHGTFHSDTEGILMLLLVVCVYLCMFRTCVYRYITQIALSIQKQQELQQRKQSQNFVDAAMKQHKDSGNIIVV